MPSRRRRPCRPCRRTRRSAPTHMTSRMTPKTIRPITSKTATTRSRSRSARNEIAAAVRMPSTRMRRISFSTNGSTNEPGSRLSVMKPTRPPSWRRRPRRSDSSASARAASSGWPLKPLPGATMLPTSRPSAERDDRHAEEVDERAHGEAAGAREVADRGDPDHDRDEDHRAGDRLDDLDERLREPLRLARPSPARRGRRGCPPRSRSAPRTRAACRACGADDPPRRQRPATSSPVPLALRTTPVTRLLPGRAWHDAPTVTAARRRPVERLSAAQARRIALAAQGFADPRPRRRARPAGRCGG